MNCSECKYGKEDEDGWWYCELLECKSSRMIENCEIGEPYEKVEEE